MTFHKEKSLDLKKAKSNSVIKKKDKDSSSEDSFKEESIQEDKSDKEKIEFASYKRFDKIIKI